MGNKQLDTYLFALVKTGYKYLKNEEKHIEPENIAIHEYIELRVYFIDKLKKRGIIKESEDYISNVENLPEKINDYAYKNKLPGIDVSKFEKEETLILKEKKMNWSDLIEFDNKLEKKYRKMFDFSGINGDFGMWRAFGVSSEIDGLELKEKLIEELKTL